MLGTVLAGPRHTALITIAALVGAASLVSFAESYRALFEWASHHGLAGLWAVAWPLMVDVFIAVGELALFVGLADGWSFRSRLGAWLVTCAGLAVSVAGNVGHVTSPAISNRATAAVPPIAAAAALAVGLGVLKRVVDAHRAAATVTDPVTVAGTSAHAARVALIASIAATNPLSGRQLIDRFGLSRTQASTMRAELVPAEMNGDHSD